MEMLQLAIKSGLPLIHLRTDDIINVEQVLSFIADEEVKPLALPLTIEKITDLKVPSGRVFYTSSDCKSLQKLYHFCVDQELTVIFVNTERSVIQFDGGSLFPPKELVHKFLSEFCSDADELMPSFGGMTLKDIGEVAKLTMTRDESLTPRGVNKTRKGYSKPRGITQVETTLDYYVEPAELTKWLAENKQFFLNPVHPSLTPRGLLFDGPPGTGKTLAAKHIAQTFGVPLYRLDLGAMMGKYVGESENNLNMALTQVDQVEPCVVIFDEVEKIFQSSSDSGVTSRLLSQLLWWLQEHKTKVFSVMTTNKLSVIPEELHREGRIDATMAFLGVEGKLAGYEFARGAFDTLMSELKKEPTAEDYKTLQKRINALFTDGHPVPQAKLTKTTSDVVKELVVATAEEQVEE